MDTTLYTTTHTDNPNTEGLSNTLSVLDLAPTRFSTVGHEFQMGNMRGVVTALPVKDIVGLSVDEVLTRRDYELHGIDPGNRAVSQPHVKKIKAGLRKHARKLLTGTLTLAISPEGVKLKRLADISDYSWFVQMSVLSGHSIFILDGQHRNQALRDLWKEVIAAVEAGDLEAEEVAQLLGKSSVPVLLILEDDKDEISRMFVTMASTKAISPSLIAVMDREQFANRVGLAVAHESALLAHAERLAYQTATATGETIYAAAAIRAAAATIFIGFRDRTPEMREDNLREVFIEVGKDPEDESTVEDAAQEVVELIDYAYERIPGWRELRDGTIEPKEFRSEYVHGTSSGLYVIAGAICAARLTPGVDPKEVIDLMADHISWKREERVPDGQQFVHPDFEGSLVVTEAELDDQNNVVGWKTRTAGGARTNYEKATRQLIDKLIAMDGNLSEMRSDQVQIAMGLKAGGKRGRPPKNA